MPVSLQSYCQESPGYFSFQFVTAYTMWVLFTNVNFQESQEAFYFIYFAKTYIYE